MDAVVCTHTHFSGTVGLAPWIVTIFCRSASIKSVSTRCAVFLEAFFLHSMQMHADACTTRFQNKCTPWEDAGISNAFKGLQSFKMAASREGVHLGKPSKELQLSFLESIQCALLKVHGSENLNNRSNRSLMTAQNRTGYQHTWTAPWMDRDQIVGSCLCFHYPVDGFRHLSTFVIV